MSKMAYVGPPGCLSTSYLSSTGITANFFCILWTLGSEPAVAAHQEKPLPSAIRRFAPDEEARRLTDRFSNDALLLHVKTTQASRSKVVQQASEQKHSRRPGWYHPPWLHLLCRHAPPATPPGWLQCDGRSKCCRELGRKAMAYCHAHAIPSALHTNFGGPKRKHWA
ncbi:hypothetical protein B0J13DRAFT_301807 [Dactylonectria estremocensis]|uniref:Uncharacterized protein n=1 Tax=Dactylonectria estremocensis TaxID=1079267 RepID=A0A9P9EZ99_9HYPO|nr:hypothetical protein B0J13DRAFT_301807 [Dactylonectria estremocensis]